MPENILEKINKQKKEKIEIIKKSITLNELYERIEKQKKFFNFKSSIELNLKKNKVSLIAEIKKASPSAGIIVENYNPVEIAKIYKSNNATCLSVLTEEDFFLGNLLHISKIKKTLDLPILCKDFFIDKYQVPLAKSYGADAILIILAGLDEKTADQIYEESVINNMSAIIEVHTIEEAKKSLKYTDAIIGINNRNLKSLITDIKKTYDIYEIVKNHKGPIVAESGFKNKNEVEEILKKTEIKTFLIGESLLKNLSKNSIFSLL